MSILNLSLPHKPSHSRVDPYSDSEMDTISGPVSTLKIPAAAAHHPKSHHLHHFNHHFHHQQPPHSHLIISSTPAKYSKLPNHNKTSSRAFTNTTSTAAHTNFPANNNPPIHVSKQSSSKPEESVLHHHRKPSTGYAVALLDAARVHNVLESAKRDVKKLSKWLSNEQISSIIENPRVEQKEKGEIVTELMKRGKFHYKHLGRLVKLLVEKNKVEMLKDVLLEFQRMYDELISPISSSSSSNYHRHQVVLVPSEMKMEEDEIVGIAERIQKITGADKIMVRQLLR